MFSFVTTSRSPRTVSLLKSALSQGFFWGYKGIARPENAVRFLPRGFSDFRFEKKETLFNCGMYLFLGAERAEHCSAGELEPNGNLAIGFRLKTIPKRFQTYLGNIHPLANQTSDGSMLADTTAHPQTYG